LNPIYGRLIELNSSRKQGSCNDKKISKKNEKPPKNKLKPNEKEENIHSKPLVSKYKTPEKVELSVISDNTQMKTKKGDSNEPVQFKVSLQKNKDSKFRPDLVSPTARSNVFTGMSPMKPKLRSSMIELIKKSSDISSKKLPRVEYGIEHLVKLPWPNDSNEDAAWVSGHHLCLINTTDASHFPSLCFLCGSAGKGKVFMFLECFCIVLFIIVVCEKYYLTLSLS
jgi:hypothetical protein